MYLTKNSTKYSDHISIDKNKRRLKKKFTKFSYIFCTIKRIVLNKIFFCTNIFFLVDVLEFHTSLNYLLKLLWFCKTNKLN